MDIRLAAAALFACLALSACGGGMELGGAPLNPADELAAGDDPLDDGTINEGTGDVIQ